jgi:GTPase-associated system helical domain
MTSDILQRFLSRKLFDIGPDDTRLDRLRKAADELASSLLKARSPAVTYALVAFDPEVPVDEPVLSEIGALVEKHWNTYRSCFSDVPRPLFRAILLEALRQGQEKDSAIAAAVALISRNVLPHFGVESEREVWNDVILSAEARTEERAENEWSTDSNQLSQASATTAKQASSALPKIDRAELGKKLHSASGPQNAQGQALPEPNPHWSNSPQAWAQEFASRASNGIADVVDKAIEQSANQTKSLGTLLGQQVNELSARVGSSSVGLRRRCDLLWWKEATYSPLIKDSYRSVSTESAAVLMAFDLHGRVPAYCPESVEHFLRETVLELIGGRGTTKQETKSLSEILAEFAKDSPARLRESALLPLRKPNGRRPLVSYLAEVGVPGSLENKPFVAAVGLDPNVPFALPDFSVWLFRELQAIGVTADSSKAAAQ